MGSFLQALVGMTMASGPPGLAVEPVFPGDHWQERSPAEVGLDAAKLKTFSDYAGGRGCVTRYGYMVYSWGDPAMAGDVASACKPFFSHFLFKAIEDGKVAGLDERVIKYEPRLGRINEALGFKDRLTAWRHVATQTSCYQLTEKPGTAFCYNDYQMALFCDTLFLRVYGASYDTVDKKVLRPLLAGPLGCQDNPTMMAFGPKDRPGRVAVSPRDFCRFGLLYLRQGKWGEAQLLDEQYAVTAVTSPLPAALPRAKGQAAEVIPGQRTLGSKNVPDNQCPHHGSYSFLWWMNGVDEKGRRLWPGAPDDAFGAFGHGGPRAMVVIPSLDLVLSWNDAKLTGWDQVGQALKLVAAAAAAKPTATTAPSTRPPAATGSMPTGRPMPGQIIVDPAHPAWLARYCPDGRYQPFFMCGPGDPEGFLYRGARKPDGTRDGDQLQLIDKLKGTGANCIYLMAVRSHGGDGDKTQNPFVDNDPTGQLNEAVLAQWETWFKAMDEADVVIFFIFYDDGASIWKTGDAVGAAEDRFIRALVDRFKHHRNLIWCVAEEYQERFTARRVSNIAAAIRAADEHAHPIAVHKLSGLSFEEFADDPNIDQFAIQYNAKTAEDLHNGMVKAWQQARGRYNLNMAEVAFGGVGTGEAARRKIWAMTMGGAYVMINGMDIATTDVADLKDCGRVVRFFEATDLREMAPHDELAAGQTQYVLARPGRRYIAYSSWPGALGLRDLPAGPYELTWFDCATGQTVRQRGQRASTGEEVWDRPSGIGEEAAMHLRVAE
jgi:hypothetical protein